MLGAQIRLRGPPPGVRESAGVMRPKRGGRAAMAEDKSRPRSRYARQKHTAEFRTKVAEAKGPTESSATRRAILPSLCR
jgi:hypothetical protein